MGKTSTKDLQKQCNDLLNQATDLSISMAGVIALPNGDIYHFGNQINSKSESYRNIRALVHSKGNMVQFICEISTFDFLYRNFQDADQVHYLSFAPLDQAPIKPTTTRKH